MDKINKNIDFRDLGIVGYKKAWDIQLSLQQQIIQAKNKDKESLRDNYFLFVSHPHVYTIGKSGNVSNMLIDKNKLEQIGAEFVETNRGGDITYHGPGQIVGYPILDLEYFFTDVKKYMNFLEEVIIKTVGEYGIKAERSNGEIGVWIDVGTPYSRKICAMGVKISRWVTMHGFALNVNTDLKYFEYIIPCGIRGKSVTSLKKELGREIDLEEVKEKIKRNFKQVFYKDY